LETHVVEDLETRMEDLATKTALVGRLHERGCARRGGTSALRFADVDVLFWSREGEEGGGVMAAIPEKP
jgi:hypothetical protein